MPAVVIWLNESQLGDVADSELIENFTNGTHSWAKYDKKWYPVHIVETYPKAQMGSKIRKIRSKALEKKINDFGSKRFTCCPGCIWEGHTIELSVPPIPKHITDSGEIVVPFDRLVSSASTIKRKRLTNIIASRKVLSKAKVSLKKFVYLAYLHKKPLYTHVQKKCPLAFLGTTASSLISLTRASRKLKNILLSATRAAFNALSCGGLFFAKT